MKTYSDQYNTQNRGIKDLAILSREIVGRYAEYVRIQSSGKTEISRQVLHRAEELVKEDLKRRYEVLAVAMHYIEIKKSCNDLDDHLFPSVHDFILSELRQRDHVVPDLSRHQWYAKHIEKSQLFAMKLSPYDSETRDYGWAAGFFRNSVSQYLWNKRDTALRRINAQYSWPQTEIYISKAASELRAQNQCVQHACISPAELTYKKGMKHVGMQQTDAIESFRYKGGSTEADAMAEKSAMLGHTKCDRATQTDRTVFKPVASSPKQVEHGVLEICELLATGLRRVCDTIAEFIFQILAATLASFILCMQCIRCYSQELRYKARETIILDVIGKTFGRPSHVLELTSSSSQYYLDHAMAICENDQTAISANMQEPRLTYSAR